MFFSCWNSHHVDPLLRKYLGINLKINVKQLKFVEINLINYITDGYGIPYAIPYPVAVPVPVAPIIPFGGGCKDLTPPYLFYFNNLFNYSSLIQSA